MKIFSYLPLELVFWVVALAMLAAAEPLQYGHANHFKLCPLAAMGLEWCPGCGIGRSITHLFHGNIVESWRQHWFGVPALLILIYRIGTLGNANFRNYKKLKII